MRLLQRVRNNQEGSMKGLIIKDLMCLRKQIIYYIGIIMSVLVLSVMFVLSAQFGNIAAEGQNMMAENGLSDVDIKNLSTLVMLLFMAIPIVMVGDVVTIIKEDGKAGFQTLSASLPLSVEKRLLSRFLTVFIMLAIGAGIDLVLSVVLSCLTDIASFADFLGLIVFVSSLTLMYGFTTTFYSCLFGNKKESQAQVAGLVTILIAFFLYAYPFIRKVFLNIFYGVSMEEDLLETSMDFIKTKSFLLLLIALVTALVCYFLSVWTVKKKRRMA